MKGKLVLILSLVAISLLAFRKYEKRISHKSFFNGELNGTPYIIIDKSDYALNIYDDDGWYASYPVVFGSKSLGDKMMEGDRKTPEGSFKIISKRPHYKWDKMIRIDYPTKSDIAKVNDRKSKGLVPKSARI